MYLKEEMDNRKQKYLFSMPGHKGNYNFFEKDMLNYDLTELKGLDNLQEPKTVIKNTINRIKKLYNSSNSYILVNGSTVGVIASILYTCKENDIILAGRNSHKSFYSGVYLCKSKVKYIYPKQIENNIYGKIDPNDIEEKLKNNNIKAVFLTSPTYEGYTLNIEEISKITKKYNAVLIVDEAHGAHFPFSESFPKSAINCGANIVVNSLHKTVPALTQTALLHTDSSINYQKLKMILNMLQTSSPSYIFMYTIDKLMNDIEQKKLDFLSYVKVLKDFRHKCKTLKNIKLLNSDDISRLIFYSDVKGSVLYDELYNLGFECEGYGYNYVICISTVVDTKSVFKDFFEALNNIDNNIKNLEKAKKLKIQLEDNNIKSLLIKDVMEKEKIEINYKNSNNKISGDFVMAYPPGIPLLTVGEVITTDVIKTIENYLENDLNVVGICNNKIKIIKGDDDYT